MIDRIKGWFTESRSAESDYITQLITAQMAAARGLDGIQNTGVYQSALNLIENASLVAEWEGRHSDALRPHVGSIARALTNSGESTYEITVDGDGALLLLPCSVSEVSGTADPNGWRYRLMRPGPSENMAVERPAGAVLAFRARVRPSHPWSGSGALAASGTAALLASIEAQFKLESKVKPARVVSAGMTVPQTKEISELIARGGVVSIAHLQGVREAASGVQGGYVRNESTAASVTLHETLIRVVSGSLGVPADLLLGASEAGSRESFRRLSSATIAPLLSIIQREWQAKIGELSWNLDVLRASDQTAISRAIGSRAGAVQKLVLSGVPLDEALSLAGVD